MALNSPARRRWAAAAAILGAAFILWLSGRMQRPLDEPSVGGDSQPIPTVSGGAGWTPPAGAPLAATAGMRRQLSGDWTMSADPTVDRTLVKSPEQGEPLREPHVLVAPQAPEGLQLLPPIDARRPLRAMLPAPTAAAAPAAAPAVSTAPARAAAAQPTPEPAPQPKRRVFFPIPDPRAKGVREAQHIPAYQVEPASVRTTDGSVVPTGISTDPGQAVMMVDDGNGYLHPLSSGPAFSPWPGGSFKNKRLQRMGDKP